MSTIVTRAGKGSPLTNNEIDSNFTNLNTDKLEDSDLSVTTNSAGTAALSYTSGVFTYTPPDLSGYAALSGATFTGEVEATGFNGDLTGAILFKGQAGEALTKGDPVYISGISGNTTIVSKADADDASKMPCFGIVDATVSANAACSVVTFGTLQGLDTSSFSEGDELFVSATGTLTTAAPTGESALLQKIAKVTRSHASSGSIKVSGAGRTNATPNLDDGNFFLGNGSNQAVSADFSTSVTNIALPLSGGALTGAVTTSSTFDGRDVATDGAKLDGIEASADVTDAANVTAAGALMDSELTSIASVKALNQGVATTDSPTFAGINATGDMTVDVAGDLTLDADGGEIFITDAGSEKARFSAGNLLVGKTSLNVGVTGQELRADGSSYFTSSSDTALGLNRLSSDGTVLEIRKDSAVVGSIGVTSGSLGIGQSSTGLGFFNTDSIVFPATAAGATRDNAIDLGYSGGRFKDLYLSGTANTAGVTVQPEIAGGDALVTVAQTNSNAYVHAGIKINAGNTNPFYIYQSGSSSNLRFNYNSMSDGGGQMILDTSGNLLIGKTTTGVSGAGVVLRGGGELFVTRAGDVMNLNRLSTDGEIMVIRKDGANKGSMGTVNGDGYVSVTGPITGGVKTSVTSASTTITSGTHLYVSAAGQTITLPASPSQGAKAHITVGNFTDTVVARNGSNIMGDASDMTLDAAYLSIQFIYVDATRGWVMT